MIAATQQAQPPATDRSFLASFEDWLRQAAEEPALVELVLLGAVGLVCLLAIAWMRRSARHVARREGLGPQEATGVGDAAVTEAEAVIDAEVARLGALDD